MDSQLYLHVTVSDTVVALRCFAACVTNVNDWMRASRFRLNPAKTEVMWLGSYQQLKHVDIDDIPIPSSRHKLKSLNPLLTLELYSTASCHYRLMLLCFVELDFFTSNNYDQLFDQPPPPKQQSRRLSAVIWTTATPCCMACQTAFCGRFSPFRTPLHVWSQELNDATISRRCCISCIGCLSVNELSTRLHVWYTSHWLVRHPQSRIHSRRHPTRYGQSPSAMLSCHQDMPHTMDAYSATEASVQQAPRVEQFTAAPATRHELCAFQASIENISIWELVNHGTL